MEKFKYFDLINEFICPCGCGSNYISLALVCKLETAREISGVPFIINSGVRCEKHNKEIGGSENSYHCVGNAVDIKATNNYTRIRILKGLLEAGFKSIIIYKDWIHVDLRNEDLGLMLK